MQRPFQPKAGLTTERLAAGTSETRINLGALGTNDVIRIYNAGSAICYVTFSPASAPVASTVPAAGTGTGGTPGGMPCGSGITEVQGIGVPAGDTLLASGITSASTADIYFTVGDGI